MSNRHRFCFAAILKPALTRNNNHRLSELRGPTLPEDSVHGGQIHASHSEYLYLSTLVLSNLVQQFKNCFEIITNSSWKASESKTKFQDPHRVAYLTITLALASNVPSAIKFWRSLSICFLFYFYIFWDDPEKKKQNSLSNNEWRKGNS